MQTIDAINEMIGYIGESPIDSTDNDYTSHPLYESALRILTSTNRAVQSRGWWFNTREVTLTPTANAIAIDPDVYLSVSMKDIYADRYTVRNEALYDLTNGTATISDTLEATVRELVAFEDLPETAAQYVMAEAATRFVKTYDGDAAKLREVKEDAAKAFVFFHADHIRNSKVNVFHLPKTQYALATSWYSRYRQR